MKDVQTHVPFLFIDWGTFPNIPNLDRVTAVEVVKVVQEGLIYRDNRLVNWCCKLKTAVSDIEVDYLDITGATMLAVPGYSEPVEFGVIISFAYPMEGGGEIVVATTRIETMLGDVAVAVHSSDERYKQFHGMHHSFSHIVSDSYGLELNDICGAKRLPILRFLSCRGIVSEFKHRV